MEGSLSEVGTPPPHNLEVGHTHTHSIGTFDKSKYESVEPCSSHTIIFELTSSILFCVYLLYHIR